MPEDCANRHTAGAQQSRKFVLDFAPPSRMLAFMPRVARIVISGNKHHGKRRAGIAQQHVEQTRSAAEQATARAAHRQTAQRDGGQRRLRVM